MGARSVYGRSFHPPCDPLTGSSGVVARRCAPGPLAHGSPISSHSPTMFAPDDMYAMTSFSDEGHLWGFRGSRGASVGSYA